MKKYDLLKVLGITLLIVTLISWVVPAGIYSQGAYKSLEATIAVGLYDLIRIPVVSIVTFIQYGLLFLTIGGFYGVLNKTGVYSKLIDDVVAKIKNKNLFLIFTTILFAVLTSVIGSPNLIFILVPFFIALLVKIGYGKMTSFAATVGSILLGQIGTTFAFSTWGYLKYIFGVEMTELMAVRVILLVMIITLYVILIRKTSVKEISSKSGKKKVEEENIDIPLHRDLVNVSKKSYIPLIIMFVLLFGVLAVGLYNWYYAFGIEFFQSLYESIFSYEIKGYLLFSNLLGGISEVGYFGNYDVIVIVLFTTLIIGWIYNLKIEEILDGFRIGCKEMIKPALYSMLACVVFAVTLNMANYGGDFIYTIINKITGTGEFSLASTVGSSLIASFAYNDFYTLAANLAGILGVYEASHYPIIAFVIQTMYSIVMVVAPTSVFLLAGLSYLEIPYKDWIKYIWKVLLAIFGIVIVIAFII